MANKASPRTPLWLDVDPGHDDAFALLIAAHCPRAHLLGVSTVHGNASLEHTTENGLSILEAIGRHSVALYPGASKPLVRDAVHAARIHGESGLDGTTILPVPMTAAVRDTECVEAMYKALMTVPPQSAWLVATGAFTNVARVIEEHPDLAGHLKGLAVMGGAVGSGFTDAQLGKVAGEDESFGNWTPYAEFNCDPEAAQFLLTHPIVAPKTTLLPLDVTHQVLGTSTLQYRLLNLPGGSSTHSCPGKPLPTPIRALFHEIMTFFARTYAEEFSLTAGPPLHDPVAVAAAFAPDMFIDNDGERFAVQVITEGEHRAHPVASLADAKAVGQLGRTVVIKVDRGEQGIRIPRTLDVTKFWDLIDEALAAAEKVSPLPGLPADWWSTRE